MSKVIVHGCNDCVFNKSVQIGVIKPVHCHFLGYRGHQAKYADDCPLIKQSVIVELKTS